MATTDFSVQSVSFQYMSDLHLDTQPGFVIPRATAPFLLLAGDIGDPEGPEYARFLDSCVPMYDAVFVVLGNHEAYGKTFLETVRCVEQLLAKHGARAVLLNRGRCELIPGKLRVVGTTLWSHVPKQSSADVRCFIQDYRRIVGWSINESNEMHARDTEWLAAEIEAADADGVRLVVVTHHAPLMHGTSHPRHTNAPLTCAYATDLRHLVRSPIVLWVFGHTHYSNIQCENGVVVASNQRGFSREALDNAFVPDASLAVTLPYSRVYE